MEMLRSEIWQSYQPKWGVIKLRQMDRIYGILSLVQNRLGNLMK